MLGAGIAVLVRSAELRGIKVDVIDTIWHGWVYN